MSNNGAAEVAAGAIMGIHGAFFQGDLNTLSAREAAKAVWVGVRKPGIDWGVYDIGDFEAFAKAMVGLGLARIKEDSFGDPAHVFFGDEDWDG